MRLEVIHDSIGPGLKELASVWEYIGYSEDQQLGKLQSLADAMQRCLLDAISAENQHRVDLEARIESLKRKAAQACQSLRLPAYFPPRGLASMQLLASLEQHIAQYEVEIGARQGRFGRAAGDIASLCARLGLDAAAEMRGLPTAGDRPDEFIPSEQQLDKMQRKLDQLQERHDTLMKAFAGFCEDIRRIAADIEYLPETEPEAAILRAGAAASSAASSTSQAAAPSPPASSSSSTACGWPLTEASLQDLQAWRLRLVKHKAMLVGTCDELRAQLATLRRRLGLDGEDGEAFLRRHQGYRPSDLAALQADLARCQALRLGPRAAAYTENLRAEARQLTALCFADADDLDGHDGGGGAEQLEARVDRLRDRYERSRDLYDTVRLYQQTWDAYVEVEQRMKDPSIFSNRGGILLKTEKEKRHLVKELPRVEARVSEQLLACPGGDRFTIGGRSFPEYARHLWEELRCEREAARLSRKLGGGGGRSSGGLPGSGSAHDLSLSQHQQQHHQQPPSPRKSLAPVPSSKR